MKIQFALCILSVVSLSACSSTSQTTASNHQTLEQRMMAKYAGADSKVSDPAPPAEGPNDVPAEAPNDVMSNPALVPSPALRQSAAGGL